MDLATLRQYLDDADAAVPWLQSLGMVDLRRAHANLVRIATCGITFDLVGVICDQLSGSIGSCADPDMALNNLDRFIAAARNPLSLGALFERDTTALPTLLQIFSTSQHFSNLLVADPESYDLLRLTEGQPVAREALIEDISSEVAALDHEPAVLRALRRFKHREMLRIAYGDIIREHNLETVTAQISHLADAILQAALESAWEKLQRKRGTPRGADGNAARFVVLALGKLGGVELNYSSDIDLIFLYDADGKTDSAKRPIANVEFFERLAKEMVGLLTEATELGAAYRVDLRLRPDGERGPIVVSVPGALHYYDLRGRTWERQAYIKARVAAGDRALGEEFLETLRPWIYRRYLSRADISGIRALKRRIEERTRRDGADTRDVKTGHGGIRDIEFVIQFLQLLNGGDLPALRTGNTLEAISQLENCGCLIHQERSILQENYRFLRKVEHRLQILFDLQTHLLPSDAGELRKLAVRMGYADSPERTALAAFEAAYRNVTDLNRRILDHLLHEAFSDDAAEAEVDLVLDPDPPEQKVVEVLGKYRFRDVKQAFRNLMSLGEEKIRFLSTRRCRHFLASIAPRLLKAIAATPDPDFTLVHLDKVSDSLGGKGVLWELFSFNPPSLRLYVEVCAYSAYLSGILTSNPGMIDGLMDSLVLDKLPSHETLRRTLEELCRAAEDLDPILHSFKNDQQLCVGVRDILGKEDVSATTGALSDIADVCLAQIAARECEKLAAKFGQPTIGEGSRAGQTCSMVVLALGKFGGREMNYHSDLDIVFLYEADGHTAAAVPGARFQATSNQHFFSELAQRIIKTASHLGAYGRLYEIDARLRPTGKSGSLAHSLDELARYFRDGGSQLWERQALCKARVVYGSPRASKAAMAAVGEAAFEHRWKPDDAETIRQMRRRMEETATGSNLKRGPGGLVDIEFLVQMLQLKHGRRNLKLRSPNTLTALAALDAAGILQDDDCELLTRHYRFLRTIEGRLRLMNSTARDKLPEDPTELAKLAHLLRYPSSTALLADYETAIREIRSQFERIFDTERVSSRD